MDNPAIFIDEVQSFTNTSLIPLNTQIDTLRSATNPTGTPLSTQIANIDNKVVNITNVINGISPIKQSFLQSFNAAGSSIYQYPNNGSGSTVGLSYNVNNSQPSYLIVAFTGGRTINPNKCFINHEVQMYTYNTTFNNAVTQKMWLINITSNGIWLQSQFALPYSSSSTGYICGSIQVIEYN